LKQENDDNYTINAAMKTEERAETEQVRRAVRAMSDVVYKQGQTQHKLMKEFAHMTHEHTVTCAQIKKAMSNIGKTFSLEEVQRTVLFVMPNVDLDKVPYVGFLNAMKAIYHDMCAIR